jgi:hypothetical protein
MRVKLGATERMKVYTCRPWTLNKQTPWHLECYQLALADSDLHSGLLVLASSEASKKIKTEQIKETRRLDWIRSNNEDWMKIIFTFFYGKFFLLLDWYGIYRHIEKSINFERHFSRTKIRNTVR